jgi:hypothetical protein
MTSFDGSDRRGRRVEDYPTFELRCRLDDGADPSRVTVFSTHPADHVERTWVTANREDTVPLEAVR